MSWIVKTLGTLCDIQIGKTPPRKEPKYWGEGHPWLSISDMNQGKYFTTTKESITDTAVRERNCRLVPAGTLLLSFKLSIGKVGFNQIPLFTNEAIAALTVKDESIVLKPYLYWALQYVDLLQYVDSAAKGKTLNKKKLHQVKILVPPLAEQQRIAAILDKADALRAKRRTALAKLDALLQSAFLDMFGDPDSKLPRVKVETLAQNGKGKIRTGPFGSQLLHSEFVDDPDGVMVLGIDNAVQNRFVYTNNRYITHEKYEQLQRYTVNPDDVLITIMGTCGRCSIVPKDIPLAINTKHLCCITLNQEKCLPIYLKYAFLLHPYVLKQLGVSERGAVMPGLNMGIIKDLSVPLPPIERQREFVEFVNKMKEQNRLFEESNEEFDSLFHSLQQRAFKGKL